MYSFSFASSTSANSFYVSPHSRQKIAIICPLKFCISLVVGISPIYIHQKSTSRVLYSLLASLYYHYYSFDMFIWATILFSEQPMEDPVNEWPSTEFHELSGFWPAQFREVVDNLHLIPDQTTCSVTHCAASKDVAVFLMLQQWTSRRMFPALCKWPYVVN
jgi:hypothetical protein